MKTVGRALLAAGLLIAAGCTGEDEATVSTSTSVAEDDGTASSEQASTSVSVPGSLSSVGEAGVGDDEASASSEPALDVTVSTSIEGGTPPPATAGGESLGPLGQTDLDVETDEGTVQIGEADVPASLDTTFPLPRDLDVQLASETATDLGFSGTTALGIDELTQFYATGLPESGYTITATQLVEGVLSVFTFEGQDRFGQVAISETPGADSSTVLVTVGDGVGQEETVQG